jgi:hypothetical protein
VLKRLMALQAPTAVLLSYSSTDPPIIKHEEEISTSLLQRGDYIKVTASWTYRGTDMHTHTHREREREMCLYVIKFE